MKIRGAWKAFSSRFDKDTPNELGAPPLVLIAVLCVLAFYLYFLFGALWNWYAHNLEPVKPIGAAIGAAVIAVAALRQAKTARLRHEEQTKADWQRRITESFSKAAEQLGSDRLEVRLGGIYTMERISKESPDNYWPVMETLTAFVRERARWKGVGDGASEVKADPDETPDREFYSHVIPTDIAAVVSVICRREKANGEREEQMGWVFDLRHADFRYADFSKANLKYANLWGANLEGAALWDANLERAIFSGANLKGAFLSNANLKEAVLHDANLKYAVLKGANLERAILQGANLEGTILWDAKLEGARLSTADGRKKNELAKARGNASTILSEDTERPAHWPATKS